MDAISTALSGILTSNANAPMMVLGVSIAAAVFVLGLALMSVAAEFFNPVRRRMNSLSESERSDGRALERKLESLSRYAHFFMPSDDQTRKTSLDRLNHAGFRSPSRLAIYYMIRGGLMAALPVIVILLAPLYPAAFAKNLFLYAAGAAMIGMIVPSYYLDKRAASRQRLLRNALPDAIDLLVVCSEAGMGLNAAFLRVAEELEMIHPDFSEELTILNAEFRGGVDRDKALRNLAKRTGLEDLKGLVAVLAQSMRFGTSIAQTLRVYADEFRDKRMQKANEEAAKLGTKMLFPLILCFFPGFFIVAIGPAAISLIKVFGNFGH
jgi:tight adherence protein C